MSLEIPDKLEHYWHDDIVRTIMRMNPQYHIPHRGSWLESIPDLEDAERRVVEVALTDLRNAWGQCLCYYRMNAKQIHLVLSPKLHLDYQIKEKAFIRANPIPNVEVYPLPELRIKSFLEHRKSKGKLKKKVVHVPELGFIITPEDRKKAWKVNKPEEEVKKPILIEQSVAIVELEPILEGEEPELVGDVDLEAYWKKQQPEPLKQVFTKNHCVDCDQFKVENNIGVCSKYNWEIALDLAERDAVCEEL